MVTIRVSGSMVMSRTVPSTRFTFPVAELTLSTRIGSVLFPRLPPSMLTTAGTTFRKMSPCAVTVTAAGSSLILVIQTFTGSVAVPMDAAFLIVSTFAQMGALVLPELVLVTSFTAVSAPPVSPVHSMVRIPSYRDRNFSI